MASSSPPTRICVFASTLPGTSPLHLESAHSLAHVLHERKIHLVYGGGTSGLMGELALERVRLGGKDTVMGIIPGALVGSERDLLEQEARQTSKQSNTGLLGKVRGLWSTANKPEQPDSVKEAGAKASLLMEDIYGLTTVTNSLAARKALMIELVATGGPGSGFIALSGGFGTLDEVMEVVTAKQMGIHRRKMVLCNVDGYWDGLIAWVESSIVKGFLREEARLMLLQRTTVEECVDILKDGHRDVA
ncbi:hypothetical protein MMC25_005258 [Agyrium rufum]|nr:hypothetical protein [Agyrium rufum]